MNKNRIFCWTIPFMATFALGVGILVGKNHQEGISTKEAVTNTHLLEGETFRKAEKENQKEKIRVWPFFDNKV